MRPGTHTIPYVLRGDSWRGIAGLQILLADGDPISAVANASTDVLTAAAHGLSNGDIVKVAATAGGLTAGRRLYVVNKTDDTLQLSLTSGGSSIDLTSAATHSLQPVAPPLAALADVRIQFRLDSLTGPTVLELTVENEGVVIDDAANWIISIPARQAPTRAGTLYYDIETIDADDVVKTYVEGTWEVGQDATRIVES